MFRWQWLFQTFKGTATRHAVSVCCIFKTVLFVLINGCVLVVRFVAESPSGKNCYVAVSSLLTPPDSSSAPASALTSSLARALESELPDGTPSPAAGALPFDPLTFTCNYMNDYATNMYIMSVLGATFSQMGCCATTGITMVQQNPVAGLAGGQVDPTVFPPCLLRYFQEGNCGPTGPVDLQNYCPEGSIASTTVITGWYFLPKLQVPPQLMPFPYMYNKTAVLNVQGVITAVLASFPGFASYPYLFNAKAPLQVQIIDYAYYNGKRV